MTEKHNSKERSEKKRMHESDKVIFIITLVISISFWLLIKLSDNYSESYRLKVQYQNIPVSKQLTKLVDTTITLTINTTGYNILVNKIKRKWDRITIDLNECKPEPISETLYQVKKSDLRNYLAEELGILENNIQINKSNLKFVLEKSNRKEVPVVPMTHLVFSPQYGLYALRVTPEKVTVYGPASILDTLQHLYTEEVKGKDIHQDIKKEIGLFNPMPALLRIVPQKVEVSVDAEKYTESVIEVPVNLSGVPHNIRTFPSKVKVFFHIALKDYNLINSTSFTIIPDIDGIDLNKVDRMKLKVSRKPEFVSGVRIDPPSVEFLIIK